MMWRFDKKRLFPIALLTAVYLAVGAVFFYLLPQGLDQEIEQAYRYNLAAYFLMGGLLLGMHIYRPLDLFEPIILLSFLYLGMFAIVPMVDILKGDILFFGVNVYDAAPRAIGMAILGFACFVVGYAWKDPGNQNRHAFDPEMERSGRIRTVWMSLFCWAGCYVFTIIYLLTLGQTLPYILSAGLLGTVTTDEPVVSVAFLDMISYGQLSSWMLYFVHGKSKTVKVVTFFLSMGVCWLRGFRYLMMILVASPVVFHYLRRNKRPSPATLLAAFMALLVVFGVTQIARDSVRIGKEVDLSHVDTELTVDATWANFQIYKTYYGLVRATPEITPYLYGGQMFGYTAIMLIPRALWPDKPSLPGCQALAAGVSSVAVDAGQAYPNLGEFFLDFGAPGVAVFMFLYGVFCAMLKRLYLKRRSHSFWYLLYPVLFAVQLQVIIRGYTSSNLYLLLALVLPVVLIKRFALGKRRAAANE